MRYGAGIVPTDDLHRHSLTAEICQGIRRVLTDDVGKAAQAQNLQRTRNVLPLDDASGPGQQQHPQPFPGGGFYPLAYHGGHFPLQHKGGRAQHQRCAILKGDGRLFPRGRKGERGGYFRLHGGNAPAQRFQRGGRIIKSAQKASQLPAQVRLLAPHWLQPFQGHVPLGKGAGLVQAQGVHPGQGFNAVKFLHQRPLASQAYHAHRQRHAGQKNQPLGNHANHGGYGGRHRLRKRHMGQIELFEEQQRSQRAQQHAHQAHQAVQVRHQHGFGRLDGLGFADEPPGIAFRAYPDQAVEQLAFHQVAAGKQLVPGRLDDGVAFPGEQGLIGRAMPLHHLAVGQYLVPGPSHHQVAQHQLLHAAGLFLPLPQHPGCRRVEQLQPLQGPLGPQLLHRADERIGKHHAQEQHIPIRPHQNQAGCQSKVQHIE